MKKGFYVGDKVALVSTVNSHLDGKTGVVVGTSITPNDAVRVSGVHPWPRVVFAGSVDQFKKLEDYND